METQGNCRAAEKAMVWSGGSAILGSWERQDEHLEGRVSVIVPVFNSELTIEKCLNSIRNQTYKNLEIIVVNDGSADGSLEKIRLLEKQDKRIKCVVQENAGVGRARNRGLDCAKGEFITFVDADDYIDVNYIEELYKALCQYEADISICFGQDEFPDGTIVDDKRKAALAPESFSVREGYSYTTRKNCQTVWGTLYRASVIKNIRFAENLYVGEDTLFFAMAAKQSKRIVHTYLKLYHYVQYKESACHGAFSRKKYTELDAWNRICEAFEDTPRVYISAKCGYAIVCFGMMRKYYKDETFQKHYYKKVLKEYRQNVVYFFRDKDTGLFKKIFRGLIALFPGFLSRNYSKIFRDDRSGHNDKNSFLLW